MLVKYGVVEGEEEEITTETLLKKEIKLKRKAALDERTKTPAPGPNRYPTSGNPKGIKY
tara:strand:+ start:3672 stop:3848 length:177 start_codon:yes stop_codon:yes gene_type:complete